MGFHTPDKLSSIPIIYSYIPNSPATRTQSSRENLLVSQTTFHSETARQEVAIDSRYPCIVPTWHGRHGAAKACSDHEPPPPSTSETPRYSKISLGSPIYTNLHSAPLFTGPRTCTAVALRWTVQQLPDSIPVQTSMFILNVPTQLLRMQMVALDIGRCGSPFRSLLAIKDNMPVQPWLNDARDYPGPSSLLLVILGMDRVVQQCSAGLSHQNEISLLHLTPGD